MKKVHFFSILILSLFMISFVSATDIQIWQGKYLSGSHSTNYEFNFTVYNNLTGGEICFSNSINLTTNSDQWWKTEQNVGTSCNDTSKDYFLEIRIDGNLEADIDGTTRRILTMWDYLRRDFTDVAQDNFNVTNDLYIGGNASVNDLNVRSGASITFGLAPDFIATLSAQSISIPLVGTRNVLASDSNSFGNNYNYGGTGTLTSLNNNDSEFASSTISAINSLGHSSACLKFGINYSDPELGICGGNYGNFKLISRNDGNTNMSFSFFDDVNRTVLGDVYNYVNLTDVIIINNKNFTTPFKTWFNYVVEFVNETIFREDVLIDANLEVNGRINFTGNLYVEGNASVNSLTIRSGNSINLSGVIFSEKTIPLAGSTTNTVAISDLTYLSVVDDLAGQEIGLQSQNLNLHQNSSSYIATVNGAGYGNGFFKFSSTYSPRQNWGVFYNNKGLTNFYGYYNSSEDMNESNSGVTLGLASNFLNNSNWSVVDYADKTDIAYYTKDNFTFFTNTYFKKNISLGQKINFAFGEFIDNVIDGWIRITGNLNVTGNTSLEGNLDLNNNFLQNVGVIDFDTNYINGYVMGRFNWDSDEGTVEIGTDIDGVTTPIGRELIIKGVNKEGDTLLNGEVVYISGAQGNRPIFSRAIASNASRALVLGMITADCDNNQECYATTSGAVNELDTSNYSEGDKLYLCPDTPGGVTTTVPEFPNFIIKIGIVTTSHSEQGRIELQIGIDYSNGVTFSTIGLMEDIVQTNYKIRSLEGNENLDGKNVMCIEMNGTTGEDVCHITFQPGGEGQASIWTRSGIVVPEALICLNNTNRTDAQCYADVGGFSWNIADFNTTNAEGADWGVTGELEVVKNAEIHENLTIGGNLNVSGKISNSLSHMIGYVTTQHNVSSAGAWYNLTFNGTLGGTLGLTFEDNKTIIIINEGHYTIIFGMGYKDSSSSPHAHVGMRITKNGEELIGSYIEQDTSKQNADIWSEHTTHAELLPGDILNMQYISSETTVIIKQDSTYTTNNFNAYGYIQEVIV